MALTNSQYDTIIKGFEAKQNRNRKLLEERTAYVYSHVAGYQELDETVSSVSVAQGRRLLEGDENALVTLKQTIRELSDKKRKLLLKSGLPENYLEPVYDCPDCKDTGYCEGVKCHCFKQAEITLLYQQSGIREMRI